MITICLLSVALSSNSEIFSFRDTLANDTQNKLTETLKKVVDFMGLTLAHISIINSHACRTNAENGI